MKILVTGAAGFIGFHLTKSLLHLGHEVLGLDNLNDYYDIALKESRLQSLGVSEYNGYNTIASSSMFSTFQFIKLNLEDRENLPMLFSNNSFDVVCNLAAQAGVRYSIEKPFKYLDSNVSGFLNILEGCRNFKVPKLVYASSSSVYGMSDNVPFSTKETVDNPISLYAATKKSNELMAYTYSHLFGFQAIGLRFFTVYGPWGRPDMAMSLFTDAILNEKPIKVFNQGNLSRDFTYIDDIVNGIVATIIKETTKLEKYKIYNIGNSKPVQLLDFIQEIENCTQKKAIMQMLPMQPGDVEKTWADTTDIENDFGYKSITSIENGVRNYVEWYKMYYNI